MSPQLSTMIPNNTHHIDVSCLLEHSIIELMPSKSASRITSKYITFAFLMLVSISSIVLFYPEPDLYDAEQRLSRRLGELRVKEEYFKMNLYQLKEDTSKFVGLVNHAVSMLSNCSIENDVKRNLMKLADSLSFLRANEDLRPPSIYHFLPHLLSNFSSLQPAYKWSKNRTGVSAILGIPTVKRAGQSYLLGTLSDLIKKMNLEEKEDTLIVVFIAEVDDNYVQQVVNEIRSLFQTEMDSGLIDIISPPVSYYPDFAKLPATLSDSIERVRWRSKQSLDYAFLMMYAYPRGMFYVQLEDDILAKHEYLTFMKDVALKRISSSQPWFVLDFCQLGFIGKLFRCADMPWVIQFFLMFFNDKPVDWLLDGFLQTKVCSLEKDSKNCKYQKDRLWVHVKPSLFQHIGTTSSLKGKVQKLKDRQFSDKIPLFYKHQNPPAVVHTSIKAYKKHSLSRAYRGETFFWGSWPKAGDYISFQFLKPIKIQSFKFKTGNAENPSDQLYNASVLVAFAKNASSVITRPNWDVGNTVGYLTVGKFNNLGSVEGKIDGSLGPVSELRLLVHNESENWVILSEIQIVPSEKS